MDEGCDEADGFLSVNETKRNEDEDEGKDGCRRRRIWSRGMAARRGGWRAEKRRTSDVRIVEIGDAYA